MIEEIRPLVRDRSTLVERPDDYRSGDCREGKR